MKRIKNIWRRLLHIKLREKLFLVFFIGCIIPFFCITLYLNSGTRMLLIEQSKEAELSELQLIANGLKDNMRVLTDISKRFYFDEELENIAFTQFADYTDIVDAYKKYTTFFDYLQYYYQEIWKFSMYINNDTLSNTSVFIVADEEIQSKPWYQKAIAENGRVTWSQEVGVITQKSNLKLSRLLRTKEGREVGVLSIYMHNKRSQLQITDRGALTMLILDEGELVHSNGGREMDYFSLRDEIESMQQTGSKNIIYQGRKCFMTVILLQAPESVTKFKVVSVLPYDDILKNANERSRSSTILMIFSFIISLMLISLYSQAFSRKINSFKDQMHRAAKGNFDIAKKIGGHDEISELHEDLNIMIASINGLMGKIIEEQVQKEQLNSRQKDVEFKMLASQINPHFLYNTLETIRMKARTNGQYEIEELVKMLAKIMRRNIQVRDHLVTFRSELELVEYYLKIQSYRFGERIHYQIELHYDITDERIMPLIIQPIVENAFVHGLEMKDGNGLLRIIVEKTDRCRIYVIDDGVGIEPDKLEELMDSLNNFERLDKTHIGLSNVNQRIKLLYGEEYGLIIQSKWMEGTTVIIELPRDIRR